MKFYFGLGYIRWNILVKLRIKKYNYIVKKYLIIFYIKSIIKYAFKLFKYKIVDREYLLFILA